MKLLSKILVLGIIVSLLQSCKHDPEDPCKSLRPVSAAFTIYETFPYVTPSAWKPYDTDTIRTFGATFTAVEEGASYEWTIGSETIRTRSFYRQDFPINVPIPVTLKVTKNPNRNCFPTDSGVATKTRRFVLTTPPPSW